MRWIRPSIITGLAIAVTYAFLKGLVEAQAFWVFATGLIVWWFRSRDEEKQND